MTTKIRLFVKHALGKGRTVPLNVDQAHYLFSVMRQSTGNSVRLFNNVDGEWEAKITERSKRGGILECIAQIKPLMRPRDLWLLFSPIKRSRTEFIVEKATEMGALRIVPVRADFSKIRRVRSDRLQTLAIEATEQCGGTFVPEVSEMQPLDELLSDWSSTRSIMFCDESEVGSDTRFRPTDSEAWAILIGPEGGFSARERDRIKRMRNIHVASLGPRILRADTAVVAAMTVWQQAAGDW
ncbi:MAG: 16S rRNA (uracil(1498)-N(3))-methyltransferase [Aestuariivita sp.]|nr:16S rRNA (uracil(1498)-N(3))-methyltransferase [Aestuariivita sp.]MCY4346620.1 16S rRNA (uracil(1498)-N(3))-methyltransferase [Aestuariivita sp.]